MSDRGLREPENDALLATHAAEIVHGGQNESAGKRTSVRTHRGSWWLRKTLTESARAAARSEETLPGWPLPALIPGLAGISSAAGVVFTTTFIAAATVQLAGYRPG